MDKKDLKETKKRPRFMDYGLDDYPTRFTLWKKLSEMLYFQRELKDNIDIDCAESFDLLDACNLLEDIKRCAENMQRQMEAWHIREPKDDSN